MGDSSEDEEFEPLFDYTRVQPRAPPVHTRDDDEPSVTSVPKKRKVSKPEVDKKKGKGNEKSVPDVIISDDDEVEWLPPPPKFSDENLKISEDSTLKKLRLKKQELASFAQSAEETVRAVDESIRKDLSASYQASPQSTPKKPVDPQPERAKIVLAFQNKDETTKKRVFMDDKFERIFNMYVKSKAVNHDITFLFDGDKINPTATPASLGMEDEDIIEVHTKSR